MCACERSAILKQWRFSITSGRPLKNMVFARPAPMVGATRVARAAGRARVAVGASERGGAGVSAGRTASGARAMLYDVAIVGRSSTRDMISKPHGREKRVRG